MKKQRSMSDLAAIGGKEDCHFLGVADEGLRLRRSASSSSRLRKMEEKSENLGHPVTPNQTNFLSDVLQSHLLQVSAPLFRPVAPLVVEPASSSEEEDVPTPILLATSDHQLLILKSSNGNIKSAPATPQEETADSAAIDECDADTASQQLNPSHAFNKFDKHAIKQLSSSNPAMTHAQLNSRGTAGSPEALGARGPGDLASDHPRAPSKTPPSPEPELIQGPGSSKARQKKFHRHFKQVAIEERVVNYYSCALVGDILLQGHLYITKNYFAFYSNVFGYVTKLLIPTVDVLKVSKEKTAKIIPNAVGICTEDEKHVFGSLLSRDTTYKLMVQVWKQAINAAIVEPLQTPEVLKHDVEDSASGDLLLDDESSGSASGTERQRRLRATASLPVVANPQTLQKLLPKVRKSGTLNIPLSSKLAGVGGLAGMGEQEGWFRRQSPVLLTLSTLLLFALFVSAAILMYRLTLIQQNIKEFPMILESENIYEEILKWQSELHSRSAHEVHEFVNSNLNQIAKVRLSLEALSMLIVTNDRPYDRRSQSQANEPSGFTEPSTEDTAPR